MLRQGVLTILMGFSLAASAGNFDFLPVSSGGAKEFQSLMNAGNYKAALMTWSSSLGATSWARTGNGHATFAYLLHQNGLPLSALEILFKNARPSSLNPVLLKLWTTELKNSPFVQKGWIQTRGGWKSIHDNENITLKIKSRRDVQLAFRKAEALPKDNINQKARIWFQIATLAPIINETEYSLRALKLLKESGQTVIGQDQISQTIGRVTYQRGELEASMMAYNEVPKASSLWIETVEERAWNSLRADDFDKALGQSITLLSPALAPLVGPESFYLANLIALKSCDYPRIFKNSENFKNRHHARLAGLQEFEKTGSNKNVLLAFERFDQKGVSQEAAGSLVEWLPRAAYRDTKFLRYMELRRATLNETKKIGELLAANALGGTPRLERILTESRGQAERLKQAAIQRARTLAKAELAEYRQILNKMHIIEGEVIHRLAVDESLKGQRSKLAKVEDQGDVLVFPYNSDEVWFDELDSYKARVKDCPTLKGAGL